MSLTAEPETAPAPDPAAAEFLAKLLALTPRSSVTWALIAINVAVWLFMVIRGTSIVTPSPQDLIAFGADYGPLTTNGQWWRLLTSTFIHIGILHLFMNMWVLWSAGPLVERMFGSVSFAAAYLIAGLAGSITSTALQPDIVSAGASGAIFGVYGLLGAFLLRQRGAMPPVVLNELKKSSFAFLAFNLIFGVTKSGIDLAAHGGGLVGGFLAGLYLARALDATSRAKSLRRSAVAVVSALALIAGIAFALPKTFDFGREMQALGAEFNQNFARSEQAAAGQISVEAYASSLDDLIRVVERTIERTRKHRETMSDRQGLVADRMIETLSRLPPILARLANAFRAKDESLITKETQLLELVFVDLKTALD